MIDISSRLLPLKKGILYFDGGKCASKCEVKNLSLECRVLLSKKVKAKLSLSGKIYIQNYSTKNSSPLYIVGRKLDSVCDEVSSM